MTDFALARRNMIDGQLRPNRVTNAQLLAAIGGLPREQFLPEGLRSVAYSDDDVPLGNGRFLMEPMVLARLIQSLQSRPDDRAMVVASGRGYGAALLARFVNSVVAVESDPMLAAAAEQNRKGVGGRRHSTDHWRARSGGGGLGALRRHPDRRRRSPGPAGDPRSARRGRQARDRRRRARRCSWGQRSSS